MASLTTPRRPRLRPCTRDGDVHLAYQVVGHNGPGLLFVPTATFLPIDLRWDEPTVDDHLRRLASFSRLIPTDLLGMGSSDAVPINDRPARPAWTDGLLAVLNAVGSQSPRWRSCPGDRRARWTKRR